MLKRLKANEAYVMQSMTCRSKMLGNSDGPTAANGGEVVRNTQRKNVCCFTYINIMTANNTEGGINNMSTVAGDVAKNPVQAGGALIGDTGCEVAKVLTI